jgi:hypothetical protein
MVITGSAAYCTQCDRWLDKDENFKMYDLVSKNYKNIICDECVETMEIAMSKHTEEDFYIDVDGYEVYCYCAFDEGHLVTCEAYNEQEWRESTPYIGSLMPFLHPKAIEDLEHRHYENLNNGE